MSEPRESPCVWVANGAASVREALADPLLRVRPIDEPIPLAIAGTPAGDLFARLCRQNDGPRHDALRAILMTALRNGEGTALDHAARRRTGRLIAASPARDGALLDRLAREVPSTALAALLDLPEAETMADDVGALVAGFAPAPTDDAIVAASAAAVRLTERVAAVWPGDDDLHANLVGVFTQAFDATAGLIGATLLALAARPQLARVAADDVALTQRVVRETARWDPSVLSTRRFAAADTTLGDYRVRTGDTVIVMLAAANRDPAANRRPDTFDPDRPAPVSFTFGDGAHACLGEHLAVTIATAVVRRVLTAGVDIASATAAPRYRGEPNLHIPVFGAP
ncbi:MAG TPA: cytochrome P450 [Candidatus Sulfotelmatobacter sp.]|nr:cytochrome P450 [Candidatus Sulfotelmatobacter sp.]